MRFHFCHSYHSITQYKPLPYLFLRRNFHVKYRAHYTLLRKGGLCRGLFQLPLSHVNMAKDLDHDAVILQGECFPLTPFIRTPQPLKSLRGSLAGRQEQTWFVQCQEGPFVESCQLLKFSFHGAAKKASPFQSDLPLTRRLFFSLFFSFSNNKKVAKATHFKNKSLFNIFLTCLFEKYAEFPLILIVIPEKHSFVISSTSPFSLLFDIQISTISPSKTRLPQQSLKDLNFIYSHLTYK